MGEIQLQSASSSASCSRLEVCTKNSSKPLKASPPDPESLASSSDRPSNRRSAYAALVREMLALCDHTWSRVVLLPGLHKVDIVLTCFCSLSTRVCS